MTWTGLYPMDDGELGREAERLARSHPERFVLKPQREGGGNNVYREDIPGFLDELQREDAGKKASSPSQGEGELPLLKAKEGYILMDLIQPPEGVRNKLVRAAEMNAREGDVVSELGVYGVVLYEDTAAVGSNEGPSEGKEQEGRRGKVKMLKNVMAGHLLRTKGRESDEGGVAVGFSVIDSPLLV